jgi:hypothetical protein
MAVEQGAHWQVTMRFLAGNPEVLTDDTTTLIVWSDHLNEPSWISRFQEAVLKGPVVDLSRGFGVGPHVSAWRSVTRSASLLEDSMELKCGSDGVWGALYASLIAQG